MSATFAEIERTAIHLSPQEKAALIELLLPGAVPDDAEPIAPGLLSELEQRAEEFDRNPVGHSIEEMEAKLLTRR